MTLLDTPPPASLRPDRERVLLLTRQHPPATPDTLIGALPYLVDPPTVWSSTAEWRAFLGQLVGPWGRKYHGEPNIAGFRACAEVVLVWRETISAADRFWKADPTVIGGKI